MSPPNIHRPVFDEPREYPGFSCLRARIGRQLGSQKLGVSLFEVPPGEAAYPYHFHLAEEEAIVVLTGRPSLRTPEGWRELEDGDIVSFLVGDGGAHQLANWTDEPIRFLAFSNQQPDIVIRPDSGTLSVAERRPDGGGVHYHFRAEDAVGYIEGEQAPESE